MGGSMTRSLRTVLILLIISAVGFSQEYKTKIEEGAKAVLFEFEGLNFLNVDEFEGGIGGKFYFSPQVALRAGFQFGNIKETTPFNATANSDLTGSDGSESVNILGIALGLELHAASQSRVSPFVGGGLSFRSISTESKDVTINPNPQTTVENSRFGELGFRAGTTLSFFGLAGVEVFLLKEVSLAGEYRFGFDNTQPKDEVVNDGATSTTTEFGSIREIGFSSAGFLTLAVYL